ncbi:hypothetical protein C0991_009496, partial [Blastosporella zonata]
MADGKLVPAQAKWTGCIETGGVQIRASFEVFDSGGSWSFLFGKPLMWLFDAAHFYRRNVVKVGISNPGNTKTLRNMYLEAQSWSGNGNEVVHLVGDAAAYATEVTMGGGLGHSEDGKLINTVEGDYQGDVPYDISRGEGNITKETETEANLKKDSEAENAEEPPRIRQKAYVEDAPEDSKESILEGEEVVHYAKVDRWKLWKGRAQRQHRRWKTRLNGVKRSVHTASTSPVCVVDDAANTALGTEIPADSFRKEEGIFTRRSDPFQKARVDEILRLVKRGEDLTGEQNETITKLIERYADIFALSVSEVLPVNGTKHTLDIPKDAKFSKK